MTHASGRTIGIIGGGIIGLCSAYSLLQAGYRVTIFDRNQFSNGCSYGNAGMVVPSHLVPLTQPGMIAKGLHWMFNSTSPFYVKPRLNSNLMRWGWLFYRHATPQHVERSIPALRDLLLLSKKLYQELAAPQVLIGSSRSSARVAVKQSGPRLPIGWQERGLLMLYKTAAAEHELAGEAKLANQAGVDAWTLSATQVQDLERDVEVDVRGAVYYPGDAHLDPGLLMQSLVTYLQKSGVQFVPNQTITGFSTQGSRINGLQTAEGEHAFDEVVIAGGAWSSELADLLGFSLPLQGGKGYSFMLENPTHTINVPAIMLETRTAVTPLGEHLRFAGTLEIAGTDQTVNMGRVRGIANGIQQYYPGMPVGLPAASSVWKGLRPCSPDGLPYIGRVRQFENLTIATGHGMMGVSLGPATGKLVAELIANQPLSLDTAPFRPDRFS